jgi:hypothetical protein
MGENINCATQVLHSPESGVRQLASNAGPAAYAREISRYISCPSTVRIRTLEQFGKAPSLDTILAMRATHIEARALFRRVAEDLGGRDEDAEEFRPRTANGIVRRLPSAPRIAASEPEFIPEPTDSPATVPEIITAIARALGIAPEEMAGRRRHRPIVRARQTCAYVLWSRGNSYPQVGRWLGGRDHSTIIHACREFEMHATPKMRAVAERYIGCAA